ncbi:tetratricopeptide repeat-containing sensor histidine kinase [uncultured Aquimarina sp.]|uniref:tetratricopeptide repeat-containing sensor histidine kinase n=1 Tax=uncultured Aquimarina sp. TaxID=575652 RepID=UPI0026373F65|nr:tetratricopeptide repeat-containing sensor histidine kinase [uncultured Aquimarina sp.]
MTPYRLLPLLFVFMVTLTTYSQTEKEYCEKWYRQMNTIEDIDIGIKVSRDLVSKVAPFCEIKISFRLADLYFIKRKKDSSMFFFDKGIKLAREINAEEQLSLGYVHKAYRLVDYYEHNNKSEIVTLLKKARKILEKNIENDAWGMYYTTCGALAEENGDYEKGLKYIDSTIILYKRKNDSASLASSYHNKGFYLQELGNYEAAAENLLYAAELYEKFEDPDYNKLAGTYYVLGGCYFKGEQYETAKKYFEKGIISAKEVKNDYIALLNYSHLSECHQKLKENEKAIKTSDSALVIAKKLNDSIQIAQVLRDKARLYSKNLNEFDKAEKLYRESYDIVKKYDADVDLSSSLEGMTDILVKQKKYKEAYKFLILFEEISNKIKTPRRRQALYIRFSEYYEGIGDSDLAIQYLKKYYKIKDSISGQEIKSKVVDLEKKYETKKKELAIVTLNQEKEEQQQITKQARAQQNLYLLVACLLLLLLAAGAWAFRKLRKQQKELVSINQVKNRLFSIIAHDLRGMIIPFQRSGKILKYHIDKGNHEKTIELSQALEQNSESLSNMLDNLLNWSLEQMNGYKMNPEKISVSEQLKEIISGYKQQATFKKTKIDLKYKEDLWVNFDKGAFHVIFRNLLGNALKYTEAGNIRIEFTSEDNLLLCSVIDTGVGMSQEQLNHLFTLEDKKSTIGTKGEKGTGLGLNLVYRFVKMHKGTIHVSSEKRIGTRFDLKIPAEEFFQQKQNKYFESVPA